MDAKQAQGHGSEIDPTALPNASTEHRPNGDLIPDPDEDDLDDLDGVLPL